VQAAKLSPSSLHSKPAMPLLVSVPLKLNEADSLAVGFDGLASIVVFGATVSTVCDRPVEVLSLKFGSPLDLGVDAPRP
jgi:hypothetical protein